MPNLPENLFSFYIVLCIFYVVSIFHFAHLYSIQSICPYVSFLSSIVLFLRSPSHSLKSTAFVLCFPSFLYICDIIIVDRL
ncbi:hypothetical protein BJV82DRAFT_603480 [Fennellomyces sp. T-0311]|nr:hypothetical protein BJV82DRAFT_603480 [Fennellomyces sp. T-0311]